MNPSIQLQEIFQAEINRLWKSSQLAPLDAADIAKLERLVSAYSKYQEKNFKDENHLAKEQDEDLERTARGDKG